jgi:FtsP/CotA-like multicopper oxidase with cupredoxin domain
MSSHPLALTRRDLLAAAGLALSACAPASRQPANPTPAGPADLTLRIGPVLANIAKDHTIPTLGYNGTVPGPLIRLKENVPLTVDLFNDTGTTEFVHWHGQILPADIDGAPEENSLPVPAHGHLRYRLTPSPAGARFLHTHTMPMSDLTRGTYTGQFAFVYIEPKENPARYDQEVFLATHEWEPFFTSAEEEDQPELPPPPGLKPDPKPNGWEIGYQRFTINGKCLGFGEPIRVREHQRVLFHILNASATENIQLALPGHRFEIVALDGNPVPKPQLVDVLELGTAERISAIVEMNNPGVWVLGTPRDDDRTNGLGIVVEYSNKSGPPRWIAPPKSRWDYTFFGSDKPPAPPQETIPLVFGKINGGTGGFNRWTINGASYSPSAPPTPLHHGRRYRLVFQNNTGDAHPVHLHRNSFELVSINGKPTSGILKDVVLVKGYGKVEADVTPSGEGLTLFHCHQQFHMDYGFKLLFNVV